MDQSHTTSKKLTFKKAKNKAVYLSVQLKNKLHPIINRVKPVRPYPLVVTDKYGIRSILYPWDTVSLKKTKQRDFYDDEFGAIKKLVSSGDLVLDIGANVGLHTAFMGKIIGSTGQVHAFEPVPQTYRFMLENIALNQLDNTKPQMLAVGNSNRTLKMSIFPEQFSAWNTFGKPQFEGIESVESIDVRTTTLDNYCDENEIKQIDFLKIDVEGFELQVLDGAKKMLSTGRIKSLSFEISQIPLQGAGANAKDIFKLLKRYKYDSYRYDKDKDRFTGPHDDSEAFYENYYASRQDLRKL